MPRLPRKKLSRIQRMIRAVFRMTTYGSPLAVAAMIGCVPEMRPISISEDGRYVALPYSQRGQFQPGDDADVFIVLDLKSGDARVVKHPTKGAFWLSNTGDVIVALKENTGTNDNSPSMMIARGDSDVTVNHAACPALSSDGKRVAYVKLDSVDGESFDGPMFIEDLAAGKTIDLKTRGTFPDISPDGKQLLFASRNGDDWSLKAMPVTGGQAKQVATLDPETAKLFVPAWFDNESVIYRAKTDTSGADGELFLTTLDGKTTALTDNHLREHLPSPASKGRIVYATTPAGKTGESPVTLHVAEMKNGKWQSRSLGIETMLYAAAGDQVVFVQQDGKVARISIDEPTKVIDLTETIKKKLAD